MKKLLVKAWVLAIAFVASQPASAVLIFESASGGATSAYSGTSVGGSSKQIYGAAFSITQNIDVTAIGGLFFSQGYPFPDDIFGALIALDSLDDVPVGSGLAESDVMGYATFHVGATTPHEVMAPLSVRLAPGSYAVVFGSGEFGTSGIAALPLTGSVYAQNYLVYNTDGGQWYGGTGGGRVFVEGSVAPVPEPSQIALVLVGLIVLSARLRVKRAAVL